jgi:hypothetical protein
MNVFSTVPRNLITSVIRRNKQDTGKDRHELIVHGKEKNGVCVLKFW